MVPGLFAFMTENFLVSTTHILHGHLWTLITAAFSHNQLWHLAINMFVLWSFGTVLEHLWGTRVFVSFYLAAAIVASVSHCAVSSFFLGRDDILALGASGARITRQLLTESVLLGAMGSTVGIALAIGGTRLLVSMAPPLPRLDEVSVNATVLVSAVFLGIVTGALFGLSPTLDLWRPRFQESLHGRGRGESGLTRGQASC